MKNFFFTVILVVVMSIFLFLVIGFFSFLRIVPTRAGGGSSDQISFDNSYLFISPLRAKANSQEKIRLTFFALDGRGMGVMGKEITLGTNQNLKIETIQALTDNLGKAVFDISAFKPGEYFLEIKIDNQIYPQKAQLSFY